MKKEYSFTFECHLNNETEFEETFMFTTTASILASAKKNLDDFLQENWGWITKQTYRNENMHSKRYWSVTLSEVKNAV